MDLNLNKSPVLNIKCDGKIYEMRKPSMGQAIAFQEALGSDKKGSGALKAMLDLIDGLGLPKEVAENLDVDQMEALISVLVQGKKKG